MYPFNEQIVAATRQFADAAAQVNRLTARNFGFSFWDVAFTPAGSLPRTDNRKIKTLATHTLYESGRLPLLYSSRSGGNATNPQQSAPAVSRQKIELPPNATPEQIQPIISAIFREVLPGISFGPNDSFLTLGHSLLVAIDDLS